MINSFIVKRSEWLHGEGGWNSRLWRKSDHKKCCLGFLGLACGLKKDDILESSLALHTLFPKFLKITLQNRLNPSQVCYDIMSVNDNPELSIEAREQYLKELFAENGIEISFVD